MNYQPQIRKQNGKDYIFCTWRHKFVRLTPEEWVRQHFLHAIVESLAYSPSLLAVEAPIMVGEVKKRCDAIVYDRQLNPLCIIEFKAPTVALTQHVYDQVAVYNRKLGVNFFIISNGKEHHACRVTADGYDFLPNIPAYTDLCQNN